jgi:rhodanese-related sulfurtransferase
MADVFPFRRLVPLLACGLFAAGAMAEELKVKITAELESVRVTHDGKPVTIMRNQDPNHTISADYAKTSRDCPPFCVQPGTLAPGVETVGELEVLGYLAAIERGDKSILVIDSRTPDWLAKGTIPGSINLPWTKLNPEAGADPIAIAETFEKRFGARSQEGLWDFSEAKTLVLFCNGPWCAQSPTNIRTLLKFGYPAHKIKWFRGGMQEWQSLGLTVVK